MPEHKSATCTQQDSLLMHIFLLKDLADAYRMADGNRIFRDIKFAFLYFFETGHIKYRLWLFRMMAYEKAILSERKAFEYKWNVCANMNGRVDGNIPDDNLVEIHVKQLKSLLSAQGANVSYESAKLASVTMNAINIIKHNLLKFCNVDQNVGHRAMVDKSNDVLLIAQELCKVINKPVFKDPILKVQAPSLHDWLSHQVLIASTFL